MQGFFLFFFSEIFPLDVQRDGPGEKNGKDFLLQIRLGLVQLPDGISGCNDDRPVTAVDPVCDLHEQRDIEFCYKLKIQVIQADQPVHLYRDRKEKQGSS